MRTILSAFLFVAALATSPAFAAPVPFLVDTCGQAVPPKAAAYLAADLDCSSQTGAYAVSLGKRAKLDLGGFTLTTSDLGGVTCPDGGCAVRNGTVTGAGTIGIVGKKMLVENTAVTMSGLMAASLNENSTLRGSTVVGTATIGIHSSGSKKRVSIVDSTVSGHGSFGVWVPKLSLVNSTVTGNGVDPGDQHADLLTQWRPRLKNSTCGRSQTLPNNPTPGCLGWCICTDD